MCQMLSFSTRNFTFVVQPGSGDGRRAREVGVDHEIRERKAGDFYFVEPIGWDGIPDEVTVVPLQGWFLSRILQLLRKSSPDCQLVDIAREDHDELVIDMDVQDGEGASIADFSLRTGRRVHWTGQADSFLAGHEPAEELEAILFAEPEDLAEFKLKVPGMRVFGWDGQAFRGQKDCHRPVINPEMQQPQIRYLARADPDCRVFDTEQPVIDSAAQTSWFDVSGRFSTSHKLPEIPELAGLATLDNDHGRYHEHRGIQAQIRVSFSRIAVDRFFDVLRRHKVQIVSHSLDASFAKTFWKDIPADCVGAIVQPDGYVAVNEHSDQVTPMSAPFYIHGRPELDAEHERGIPFLIERGGMPIVGDRLLRALRKLDCEGETAPVIYRGHNQNQYDTVQPRFQRFLPSVRYTMSDQDVNILPVNVPEEFGICAFLRNCSYADETGEKSWYELGVSRAKIAELRQSCRRLLFDPVFRHGGPTHAFVCRICGESKKLCVEA